MSLDDLKIGFIGGGNMAKAIAEGILKKGLVKSSNIIVSAPSETTISSWKSLSVNTTHSNPNVICEADVIFLAFKPYQLDSAVIRDVRYESLESKLFVSVLAGITSDALFEKLTTCVQKEARLIRVMPNTPAMVCEGCSAIAPHFSATKKDVEIIRTIFSAVGVCEVVPEHLISAVTGLTGSGPAYVSIGGGYLLGLLCHKKIYTIIDALSDGAVKQGLPRDTATTFAAQTVMGAAKMVLETKKHPSQLKDEVCSAGGTTIYGIHALEKGSLRATLMNAVEAATMRGQDIGKAAQK